MHLFKDEEPSKEFSDESSNDHVEYEEGAIRSSHHNNNGDRLGSREVTISFRCFSFFIYNIKDNVSSMFDIC